MSFKWDRDGDSVYSYIMDGLIKISIEPYEGLYCIRFNNEIRHSNDSFTNCLLRATEMIMRLLMSEIHIHSV